MNFIDIIILIILCYGMISGYRKGIVKEIGLILALLVGVYLCIYHSSFAKSILVKLDINLDDSYLDLIAIILTFACAFFAIYYVAIIITKVLKTIFLGQLNRILGAIFGIFKMTFILSIIFFVIIDINDEFNIISEKYFSESKLLYPISDILPTIYPQSEEIDII